MAQWIIEAVAAEAALLGGPMILSFAFEREAHWLTVLCLVVPLLLVLIST